MNTADIISKNYYDIDLKNNDIIFIDSDDSEVLTEYITKTVNFVLNESTKCQQYKVRRETNEVFTIVSMSILNDNIDTFNENCKEIAEMLLESEIKITRGAIEPVSGGLVQAIIRKENGFYYVLIKNEFFSAVNRTTMEKIEAFLHDEKKRSPLKICIFDLSPVDMENNPSLQINTIYIDDSIQTNHSVYWYDYFLSLDKCNTNEVNTNNAVDKIISFWDHNIDDPHEALNLRNDTITYFRANDNFDLDNFIENIKDRHEFDNTEIFDKLVEISDNKRKGFDKRFEISQADIKKRIVTKKFYPLASKTITLSIEGKVDFNDVYVVEENGNYIIKIRTDDSETIRALTKPTQVIAEI